MTNDSANRPPDDGEPQDDLNGPQGMDGVQRLALLLMALTPLILGAVVFLLLKRSAG